jgi:hypothetical protein
MKETTRLNESDAQFIELWTQQFALAFMFGHGNYFEISNDEDEPVTLSVLTETMFFSFLQNNYKDIAEKIELYIYIIASKLFDMRKEYFSNQHIYTTYSEEKSKQTESDVILVIESFLLGTYEQVEETSSKKLFSFFCTDKSHITRKLINLFNEAKESDKFLMFRNLLIKRSKRSDIFGKFLVTLCSEIELDENGYAYEKKQDGVDKSV